MLAVTAVGKELTRDARYLRLATRICAELGAHFVKTYYCAEGFDTVTAACPVPLVMWVGHDGDDLLFSTVEGRVKHRNMLRDPRVSVTVIDSADPENYAGLSGRVSITPDVGRRLDTRLSWKYEGKDPGEDRPGAVRVVVRMVVQKATGHAR